MCYFKTSSDNFTWRANIFGLKACFSILISRCKVSTNFSTLLSIGKVSLQWMWRNWLIIIMFSRNWDYYDQKWLDLASASRQNSPEMRRQRAVDSIFWRIIYCHWLARHSGAKMQLRIFPFQRMFPVRQDRCIQMDEFHGFRLARHEMTRQAWIWVDRRGNIFDFLGRNMKTFPGKSSQRPLIRSGSEWPLYLGLRRMKAFLAKERKRGRNPLHFCHLHRTPLSWAPDLIFST